MPVKVTCRFNGCISGNLNLVNLTSGTFSGLLYLNSVKRNRSLCDGSLFVPFFRQEWNSIVMNLAIAFSRDALRVRRIISF